MCKWEGNKQKEVVVSWLGYSNHMCGLNESISDFDNNFKEIVKLRDNSSINMSKKGNIRMLVNDIIGEGSS